MRLLFICHGNICRSPMAQCVMSDLARKAGLGIGIDSAAVSREEEGNPIYPPAQEALRRRGIPILPHRARLARAADLGDGALLLAMDRSNLRRLAALLPGIAPGQARLLGEYGGRGEIDDPWYTRDFDGCLAEIIACCEGLLREIRARGGEP
ncbi:MAG: low molecular weight phosphotyrosine protein phosphatase [Succinivibrionaceae bacterium]|nr:low molecular weight phosphotyrosine protein phosphatase [Succinivibrionaceae bacterium]